MLPAGTHTLRLDTDTTDVIAESDKNDNSYSRTFVVISTNAAPPQLLSSFYVANGQFHLTLSGIPSRTYEIQASSNLTDWVVLSTLADTNANGLLQFSDRAGSNFPQRFYRTHLLGP